jgi:hypothetical protein
MIRYALVILLMATPCTPKMPAQRRGQISNRFSRTAVAQIATSVRSTCLCGLYPAMGPSRGRVK